MVIDGAVIDPSRRQTYHSKTVLPATGHEKSTADFGDRAGSNRRCGDAAASGGAGQRLLQRQDLESRRRVFGRWRLRPICAALGAPFRPPHPGPTERRRAEHAGRREPDGGSPTRQRGAEGRHRHHHVRPGAHSGVAVGAGEVQREVLRLSVSRRHVARGHHLLRVARNRHQELGRHDAAKGVPGRPHREGLCGLCQRGRAAQSLQRAGPPGRRLSRQQ
jgi:hypothetical protein